MSYGARAALAREAGPELPDAAVERIARRTRDFAEVFAVCGAGKLADLAQETGAALLAAVDTVINAALDRAKVSPEATVLAWAGGALLIRQADRALEVLGADRQHDDPWVARSASLARLTDPASPRLAEQVAALAVRSPPPARRRRAGGGRPRCPGPGCHPGGAGHRAAGRPSRPRRPGRARPAHHRAVRADPGPGKARRPGGRLPGRHGGAGRAARRRAGRRGPAGNPEGGAPPGPDPAAPGPGPADRGGHRPGTVGRCRARARSPGLGRGGPAGPARPARGCPHAGRSGHRRAGTTPQHGGTPRTSGVSCSPSTPAGPDIPPSASSSSPR